MVALGSLLFAGLAAVNAHGQTTLATAELLSLSHSPRIKLATDDLRRARAVVSETKDAYIPNLVANGGAGDSYGITLSVPTILTVNAQSLVYSSAQRFYLRASKLSLQAATLALQDVREQIEEDTAVTYVSLNNVQETAAALNSELQDATALQAIVQQRFNAGLENELEVTQTRRQMLAIELQQLQLEDEAASLRQHLSALTGLSPDAIVVVSESIPAVDSTYLQNTALASTSTAERMATAGAQAKQQHAAGDASYRWRPLVAFAAQYGRVSPINDVSDYYNLHGKYNVAFAGVSIQLPIFDAAHRARAEQAGADAAHATHELQVAQQQRAEDRLQLAHSLAELTVRSQIAEMDLSIAEAQLKATRIQVTGGGDGGPVLSPKDEQNARMQSRQRLLDVLNARFQMKKSQITLLRMTGELEGWLHVPPSQPTLRSH